MARLRAPDGCPWDREQDERSLRAYVIEEAHEVVDAIESGDPVKLQEELGDLLFQIIFLAQLAGERGEFTMDDVVGGISDKMERRHPHVFGDEASADVETVRVRWEQHKAAERGARPLLDGVPRSLPALHRARRLTDRAAAVGFEWPDIGGVWGKLDEEYHELREAESSDDIEAIRHEYGDVLFAAVNVGRFLRVDPEDALQRASERFIRRFGYIEKTLKQAGSSLEAASLEEMDGLWNEAKRVL